MLLGRDVVPHFAISSCSVVSKTETFALARVHIPSFYDGAVLPSLCGVSNLDTFCDGLLVVILHLAALLLRSALSVDVTSQEFEVVSRAL